MSAPQVSVNMTVYNAERYLAEAVESVLAQTFRDFEFIIIDDGSTDESRAILERYAGQDGRIRLVSRPNTGIVVARNEALGLARGELIAVMDSDDVALPSRFEVQVTYLHEHPECVAVGSGVLLIDPEGAPICGWSKSTLHEEIDAAHIRCLGGAMVHPATMFRRDVLLAIGGYRAEFELAEDLDIYLRLADHGRLANVPDVLLQYRQHPQSFGHQRYRLQMERARAAVNEARRRRGLPIIEEETGAVGPPASMADHHQKWTWWALGEGNVRTARKHALRTLRLRPFSVSTWRAAACALRGH